MMFFDAPAAAVESVVLLSSPLSQCEIVRNITDDELGDRIQVRCGWQEKSIGRALKGVSADRLSACSVALTIYAVQMPKLLAISNCSGILKVSDVGSTWIARLRYAYKISPSQIEFVSFEKTGGRAGCYKATVTYDTKAGQQNTPYDAKSGVYCILQ
jgi:hypothetical protein